METHSDQFVENMTVIGASGVQLFVAYDDSILPHGHPFIPMLRIFSGASDAQASSTQLFDVKTASTSWSWIEEIVDAIQNIQSGKFEVQLIEL